MLNDFEITCLLVMAASVAAVVAAMHYRDEFESYDDDDDVLPGASFTDWVCLVGSAVAIACMCILFFHIGHGEAV